MKTIEFIKLTQKNNCDCDPKSSYFATFRTTLSVLFPFPVIIKGVNYPQYKVETI
jgi:hypothetical protein